MGILENHHIANRLDQYDGYNRNNWLQLNNAVVWDWLSTDERVHATCYYNRHNGVSYKPKDLRAYDLRFALPTDATPIRVWASIRMKITEPIEIPSPSIKFNITAPNHKNLNNTRNWHETGWHTGYYVSDIGLHGGSRDNLSRGGWLFEYEMPFSEFIKAGYSPQSINDFNMGADIRFHDANVRGSYDYSCQVWLGYLYMGVEYVLPNHQIGFAQFPANPNTGDLFWVDAHYTQSEPNALHGGLRTFDVLPSWGEEIKIANITGNSHFDWNTKKWTVDSTGSQHHILHLGIQSHVIEKNTLLFNNPWNSFVHESWLGYGVDGGYDGIKLAFDGQVREFGKACAYLSIEGYSPNSTNDYRLECNRGDDSFRVIGWEIAEKTANVSIKEVSDDKKTVTLNVPQQERFTAYLKVCFVPFESGANTFTAVSVDTQQSDSIDINVDEGMVFHVSATQKPSNYDETFIYCPCQKIKFRSNRIFSDVESDVSILPFRADDGDSLMYQKPISLHINKQEELDYIGCVPLEHLHFDPKSTYKDTLINTNYKNKRYMGKKLASDEDISLNVRLHPKDVTTIQGLIDMDKPIPINANHKCFEGDALNHRGWAEIYAIKSEETNPHWYKCDIDVKYLTHNLNTRLAIETGNEVSSYPMSDVMYFRFNSGDNLSTDETNYFKVDTDGTFNYIDGVDSTLRNLFKLNNGEHLKVQSREKLANITRVAFNWYSVVINEYRENNVVRLIKLVDKDGNSVFEYEYTDYEVIYDSSENIDKIKANIVYRIRTVDGWENVNKEITLRTKLVTDINISTTSQTLYGTNLHFELNNNKLKIIDEGFSGREVFTENAIDLIGDEYYWVTEWKNRNIDAETMDTQSYLDFIIEETMLASEFATMYPKSIVSPFPVAKKHLLFTREAEEGTVYYYEDDGEEFSYLIEPFYQYQNGTDLVTSDGSSIFSLNYGYEIVYIQNGLVRLGFNRINGEMYLGKYDPQMGYYVTTQNLRLDKYSDVNVKSLSDDKIEIQASDIIFTIWRGHPYIMINHPTEDIIIDTRFNRVWAEGVGNSALSEYPEYWDLNNNSNLLPQCVGGVNELKSDCLEVSEENIEREITTLEWDSEFDFDDIIVGNEVIFEIDKDSAVIDNPTDYIEFENGKSIFGSHTVEFVTDHTVPTGLIIGANTDTINSSENATFSLKLMDDDGVGISGKTITLYDEYFYEVGSVRLKSNKDILNASDSVEANKTATLTGTLVDGRDGSRIPNQTVDIYEVYTETELLLSSDKDNLNASDSVEANKTANLKVVLEDEDGSRIQGETVEVWGDIGDIYDPCTAPSDYWNIPSSVTSVYDDEGWKVSANAYSRVILDEQIRESSSVEFTLVDYDGAEGYSPVVIVAYADGSTSSPQSIITGGNYGVNAFTCLGQSIYHAILKDATYKIEYTSSTISVYENGALLATATNNVGLPTHFEFHIGANNRFVKIKDVKLEKIL